MMIRQIVLPAMLAVLCWTGNVLGQSSEADSSTGLVVQASLDPLPDGVVFPQWYRTDYEKEAYSNSERIVADGLLQESVNMSDTEESKQRATQVLSRMATFLNAQNAVSFTLEYELNQQETMGAVATGKKPFETFDIEFAKPNLFKASCTRERNAKYRWEIGSDGKYLQRITNGNVSVEPAAENLKALLRQKGTESGWSYYVNLREVFSMFDPNALAEQTWGSNPRYAGTRNFGSIDSDYVIFDLIDDSVYQRLHLFVSKGKYPVPLMMVRDGDRVYPDSFPADDPGNKQRMLDTEWRFTNWQFNQPVERERFKHTMPKRQRLVVGDKATSLEKPVMGKFVGSKLPDLTVYDQQGNTFRSDELLGDKPAILFFWHDEGQFHQLWREIVAAEERFGADKIRTFAIYINPQSKQPEAVQQIMKSAGDPETLKKEGIKTSPRIFATSRYGDRRVLQDQRYVISAVCAAVDGSGKIVMQRPGYGTPECRNSVMGAADAILQGRDYIAEQKQSISSFAENQKTTKEQWDQKFQSSWKND